MKKTFLIVSTFLIAMSCTKKQQGGPDRAIESRIDSLLKIMTIDEKIGQMNQLNSSGNVDDFRAMIKSGSVGSFLNEIDPQKINEMQRIALEEARVKIPILFARDVIHGFKTILPIPLGQAASWNPEMIEAGAKIAATEASEKGIRWTFAPMVDVTRDPRWGRIAESLGEDPFLSGTLGAAMVRGFQGNDLSSPSSVAACVKHYAGYGAVEGGRDYNNAFIPTQTLREVYLPSYEACVKAGAATIMSSFNEINGVPSTCNSFLLKKVLRQEWGFKGMVVSDWASVGELIPHGIAADEKEAATKSINAGMEMEMVSSFFIKNIKDLLKEGLVKEEEINQAVRNILRVKFMLGLFENPYVDVTAKSSDYSPEHLEQAKQIATQSLVLLKNSNNTLPLKQSVKSIAVIGPLADAPYDQMGTWVLDGDETHTQTPLKALKDSYSAQIKIIYEKGLGYSRDNSTTDFEKALAASRNADITIFFAGEESILSGEARCRADINLPGAQSQLIKELKKSGKPLVMVVLAGRPLTIEKECTEADAVIYAWHPGTMGGPAIADVLFGKAVPSGKLPVTFPKTVGQIPIYYAHKNTGRPPREPLDNINSIPVGAKQFSIGNTSYYLDAGAKPLFPFGYGLSYTTFIYDNLKLNKQKIGMNDSLIVTCDIKNNGNFEGDEIVQLYTRDLVGSITRPVKELKGFMRISLKPGEVKTVSFTVKPAELSFWNSQSKKVIEKGMFNVWIAPDSDSGPMAEFELIE